MDTSQHCLYQGVVLYPGIRAFTMEYPIILCQKVRQYSNTGYYEDYITSSVVNMADGIIVVYYSYHINARLGKVSFAVSSTSATGAFAYCKKPRAGADRFMYLPAERRDFQLGAQMRPFGWGTTEDETFFGYSAHVSRGYNGSLCLTLVSVVDEAVIQYHPGSYPKPPLKQCAVAMIQSRDTGHNELDISITYRIEAVKVCNVSKQVENWKLTRTIQQHALTSDAFVIENLDSSCFSFALYARSKPKTSGYYRKVIKHRIGASDISTMFLEKRHLVSSNIRHLNNIIILTNSERSDVHYGIAHSSISLDRTQINQDIFVYDGFNKYGGSLQQAEIRLLSEGCTVNVTLTIYYLLLEHEFACYYTSSLMKYDKFTLSGIISRTQVLRFFQYHYHVFRFIFVNPILIIEQTSPVCVIRLTMYNKHFLYGDPGTPVFDVLPELLPNINTTPQWYILWIWKSVTWEEAAAKCQSIGGGLPMLKYPQDYDTLKHLLWRNYKSGSDLGYGDPCRVFNPLCHVFIGLHPDKVGVSATSC